MLDPLIIDIPVSGRIFDTTIFFLNDAHLGADDHDERVMGEFIRTVKGTPHAYWISTGDIIDADRPSMRDRLAIAHADHGRSEAKRKLDRDRIAGLKEYAIRRLAPIRNQCAGILDGDHFIQFADGTTSGQYIANKMGGSHLYLGERMAYVVFRFTRGNSVTNAKVMVRHYKGSHATDGADMNGLQKANLRDEGCDIYVGAHTHRENCCPVKVRYLSNQCQIRYRVAWFIRGGTMLDGYPQKKKTYAESSEYHPLPIGWGQATLSLTREGKNAVLIAGCNSATLRAF